jgi:hypothetical protein
MMRYLGKLLKKFNADFIIAGKDYLSPEGEFKLTEPNYSIRLKETIDRKNEVSEKDVHLLKYERHLVTDNKT